VTICHIPPGNPDAAHTITVGAPAVWAHLGHGDILGPCPADLESRFIDYDSNVVIYILDDSGSIEIYGFCDDSDCVPVAIIDVTLLIGEEDFEIEFSGDPDDGFTIVIYYLHPFPDDDGEDEGEGEDTSVNVFQVNVYYNDTLVNDNTLVMVDEDGTIVGWATHNIWNQVEDFRIAFDIE
jgi:hypothetical protein